MGMKEEPQKEEGQYLTIPNFTPPEDKAEGEDFTGTFRGHLMPDGRLCVTAVNDIPLKGGEMEEEMTEEVDNPEEEVVEESQTSEEPDSGEQLNKLLGRSK